MDEIKRTAILKQIVYTLASPFMDEELVAHIEEKIESKGKEVVFKKVFVDLKDDHITFHRKGYPETEFCLLDEKTQLEVILFLSELVVYSKGGGM